MWSRGAFLIFLVGSVVSGGAAMAENQGNPERGKRLFRACKACHSVEAGGGVVVGPPLHGVFGRRAGTVDGYKYSGALANAKIVWTEETIDSLFALGPDVFTPGSKMPLQAMTNPKDRADLIAYLRIATAAKRTRKPDAGN